MAAKASFVGAKMVNGPGPLRVSTRPAWVTAVTRVDSTGLLPAAVAAGSSAMPLKLPSPSAGTEAHAVPLGDMAAISPLDSDGISADSLISPVISPAIGIRTLSMMWTVALAVTTSEHTTAAPLTVVAVGAERDGAAVDGLQLAGLDEVGGVRLSPATTW